LFFGRNFKPALSNVEGDPLLLLIVKHPEARSGFNPRNNPPTRLREQIHAAKPPLQLRESTEDPIAQTRQLANPQSPPSGANLQLSNQTATQR
jgi:hypothetical protein